MEKSNRYGDEIRREVTEKNGKTEKFPKKLGVY